MLNKDIYIHAYADDIIFLLVPLKVAGHTNWDM